MDDDFCYLTTSGRVSGAPHEIEIWYEREGATLYLLAGGGDGSDWVRNLRANSACEIRWIRGGEPVSATGRVLPDGNESERARDLVFAKYQARYDGDLRDWRVRALPVAVDLDEARR